MAGGQPVYVLDTNVFVEAARRYYAFDIVPGFWKSLIEKANTGQILSIDRVKSEIDRGEDDLKTWANNSFNPWFASTDDVEVTDAYRSIIEWANKQAQFIGSAKADISRGDNADAWLVAFALSKKCIVVTHEQHDRYSKTRIPIPNVCQAFNVQWLDVFQMLRELRVKL
ncbi:Uncharacterised protein [uncultured archaeon]|nr:Uncharacterised protein [uncultured archaeon]